MEADKTLVCGNANLLTAYIRARAFTGRMPQRLSKKQQLVNSMGDKRGFQMQQV